MNLAQQIIRRAPARSSTPISINDWVQMVYQGQAYGFPAMQTMPGGNEEKIDPTFQGYVEGVYKSNGVVFACMLARLLLFSEARFQFRRRQNGRPGEMFGTSALQLLETPWENGTTGDLLTKALLDVDLAGNFYAARRPNAIRRLRPDWVSIILGSKTGSDIDLEIAGYAYHPGGRGSDAEPEILLPEEVAHFAPIPDPTARYRGMSWLTPVLREISADGAATTHKQKFFENGATVNLVVKFDPTVAEDAFNRWVDAFEDGHKGIANAYQTLYLGGGADVVPVGADMKQLDFKATQGAGETRIAAAAGVPPVIVGLSEGLQAATYSNYSQARRRFADGTMRPLWRSVAGALQTIVPVPANAELWYDDRDIPFLQEDMQDAAEIQQKRAITIRNLVDSGFEPESVIAAVDADDLKRLKHSGLYSVQLQKPGADTAPAPSPGGDTPPTTPPTGQ